ncbi:MAG: HD domain-containing protein [Minisyncoccia bacterium]
MQKKFSKKFTQLLDFVKFMHEFREVERYEGSKLGKKAETDSEHSYQMAMVAWFLIEQDKLKLNKELCLMYALAHDLVEIYAEDTFVFDQKKKMSKQQREKDALVKIKKRFSKFKKLIKIIQNYEKRKDQESNFIYFLDKLLPPIQIYLEDGKMWHKKKVSFSKQVEYKSKMLSGSPYFNEYWRALVKELTRNKKKMFPK